MNKTLHQTLLEGHLQNWQPMMSGGYEDEVPLCYAEIDAYDRMLTKNILCRTAIQVLEERSMPHKLDIMAGKRRIELQPRERRALDITMKSLGRDSERCIMHTGIVVTGMKIDGKKEIPVVLNDMGIITVRPDRRRGGQGKIYAFYRLYRRTTGLALYQPKRDRRVEIFSHFGYEPRLDGSLTSLAACMWQRIQSLNMDIMVRGAVNFRNANPVCMVQAVDANLPDGAGKRAVKTYVEIDAWYADGNRNKTADKIRANAEQVRVMEHLNDQYSQMVNDSWSGSSFRMSTANSQIGTPSPYPFVGVPLGYQVANGPVAVAPPDIIAADVRATDVIFNLLGVPQTLFTGQHQTTNGARESSQVLNSRLATWNEWVNDIIQRMLDTKAWHLKAPVYAEIVKTKLPSLHDLSADALEAIIREAHATEDVTIQFSLMPYENTAEIFNDVMRGLIPYSDYRVLGKTMRGMPVTDEDRKAEPPWDQPMAVATAQQPAMDPEQAILWQAMQAQVALPPAEGEDGGGKKNKKKKSTDKEDKPKKKKQKTESEKKDKKKSKETTKKKEKE